MTVQQLASSIGCKVLLVVGELQFECIVRDAKIGYGKERFLIEPVAGTGRRWVEFASILPYRPAIGTVQRMDSSRMLR